MHAARFNDASDTLWATAVPGTCTLAAVVMVYLVIEDAAAKNDNPTGSEARKIGFETARKFSVGA